MSRPFFITSENFSEFLRKLSVPYDVFVPVKKGRQRFYQKFPVAAADMVVGEVRSFEPLKAFFSRAREVVAYDFQDGIPDQPQKPFAIVGVKACDLKGFKIQDFVFYPEHYRDPIYAKNREANLVISSDCTCAIETCFCLALGVQPFPQEEYDINISPINAGYIMTVGSDRGENIILKHRDLFKDPPIEVMQEQNDTRERVRKEVEENIRTNNIPLESTFAGIIARNFSGEIWADEAKTCVECGACNTICPTCHCFLLYDQKNEKNMERFRIWDSCMIKDFARVAGGGNPRAKLWMRLRNRFEKKFDFFPKVSGLNACTGCGRCVSACPAKIDIRKVLRRLVDHV